MRKFWAVITAMAAGACAAGSGGRQAQPAPVLGALAGQRVLLLPLHYVQPVDGDWPGGAASAEAALRRADDEIAFALAERRGTTYWVLPREQTEVLARERAIAVNPFALSAAPLRPARRLEDVPDPLHGQVRRLAALFDARLVLFPVELRYERERLDTPGGAGRASIWAVLVDARAGDVLWSGWISGAAGPVDAPAAVASAAQALAALVAP